MVGSYGGSPPLKRSAAPRPPTIALRSAALFLGGAFTGVFLLLVCTDAGVLRPPSALTEFRAAASLADAGPAGTADVADTPPPDAPPPDAIHPSARPAGEAGGVAARGRRLPPPDAGCAALRGRFVFYNRPPKTGSSSLRSTLRAVARACGLVEVPCHMHGAPNNVGFAGAAQLAGCGAVMACHVADTPGVRAAVDRLSGRCPGGGLRLTSVRGMAGRDAAALLQVRKAYASAAERISDAEIRAGLAGSAGDELATFFGLVPRRPAPPTRAAADVAAVATGGILEAAPVTAGAAADNDQVRASPPPLTRAAIVDHLLWYDALVDLTDGRSERAAALLSAVLGVRVGVAKENARTSAAFVARVARIRSESRPPPVAAAAAAGAAGGGGDPPPRQFPDEVLYDVARDMYRHQLWFTIRQGTFNEEADAWVEGMATR